jgi:hypothetical protein
MSGHQEVTYTLEVGVSRQQAREEQASPRPNQPASGAIPRIARLLALAIRLEGLIRQEEIRDYAEVARLGRVTRARITQIMKLLDLAPDIQEQILFLAPTSDLNERTLRPVAAQVDWEEQRRLFQELTRRSSATSNPV